MIVLFNTHGEKFTWYLVGYRIVSKAIQFVYRYRPLWARKMFPIAKVLWQAHMRHAPLY